MANGITTGGPRGINKGFRIRQTPEEGRRTYQPKRGGNNNKDEENSPKTLNDRHDTCSKAMRNNKLIVNVLQKLFLTFNTHIPASFSLVKESLKFLFQYFMNLWIIIFFKTKNTIKHTKKCKSINVLSVRFKCQRKFFRKPRVIFHWTILASWDVIKYNYLIFSLLFEFILSNSVWFINWLQILGNNDHFTSSCVHHSLSVSLSLSLSLGLSLSHSLSVSLPFKHTRTYI